MEAVDKVVASDPAVPSQQKRKGGRKGKKEWRKNVDIADVEENLAELVEEEIAGGKLHERKDEDLFTVDVTGNEKAAKRAKGEPKKLRVEQILEKRSHVPAPLERVVLRESSTPQSVTARVEKLAKRIQTGEVKRETRADRRRKRARAEGQRIAEFDLWDDAGSQKPKQAVEVVVNPKVTSTPAATHKPKTVGRHHVQFDAVQISHPGASYRPTQKDHEALMQERQDMIDKHHRADRAIDAKLSYPEEWDEESDNEEGAHPDAGDDDDEEEGDEAEVGKKDGEQQKKKETQRKTKAQRNREKRLREQSVQAAQERKKKKVLKELGRLPEIRRKVEEEKAAHEKRVEERKQQRTLEATQPKSKLGKHRVPETPAQVQKVEDLTDSLRRLKTEGSLLRDRYQSLLERNIIEPRVRVGKRRKYKRKTYEKPSFRNFQ
ncbi:ribosome biogenesis protein Nop53/GLTSCR2 [Thamnocephalis sphaerospora]|uniref:Ribosome biogenesis protein NOP53 n=1 Tax=Thamnocephalis sphaerospora TaxID=78915 RepID=A0A4P9XVB6_9FUNG|nr:ribosome biogenesis protein Nop53/GLTSCR2 [Thamnocephalis sphaerospora]|eukprot:RKP10215.1 ribosome biogenesis protein Nop53/GLTSCR2 [Thamnocephalis sphaerospora]